MGAEPDEFRIQFWVSVVFCEASFAAEVVDWVWVWIMVWSVGRGC